MTKKGGITVRVRPLYNLKIALVNLLKNGTNTIGSILIMSFTFAILGIVFMIVLNVNSMVKDAQSNFDEIGIFLREDTKPASIQTMYDDLNNIIGVKTVKYVNKDIAFERWKKEWGDDAYLLEGIGESPLPNAFYLSLSDISYTKSVAEIVNAYEGIEEVKYYRDEVEKMLTFSKIVAQIGFGVITVLLVLCFFVVSNTVKIAVNSRQTEINIMKYVGANNFFIRGPFIVEGILIGTFSAIISSFIVFLLYKYVLWSFGLDTAFTMEGGLFFSPINAGKIIADFGFIALVLGIGIGALGSITSTRKHLKV